MKAHLEQPSPALDGLPVELAGLLERMLAKDPAVRPTASEVIAELEPLRGAPHLTRLLEQSRPAPISGFSDGAVTNAAPLLRSVTRSLPKPVPDAAPVGTPRWWFALGLVTALAITVACWIVSRLMGAGS